MFRRPGEFQSWAVTRFGRNSQSVLGIELHSFCVRKIICGVLLSFVETGCRLQRFQWQGICIMVFVLITPTNPSPHLYLRVMWIRTLGHMGGSKTCGGDTLLRVTATCWLMGLWSTQAKVGGIMLKAAWHWGSDSSVVNNSFGEPCHTPLYVGLPSAWSSVDVDRMFFPHFLGELLNWGLGQV